MADDKRYMGFWIGHLHQGERNRIHSEGPNHQEREMLAKGEDPWAKFRGPLPPSIQPYVRPVPQALADEPTSPQPPTTQLETGDATDVDIVQRIKSISREASDDHHWFETGIGDARIWGLVALIALAIAFSRRSANSDLAVWFFLLISGILAILIINTHRRIRAGQRRAIWTTVTCLLVIPFVLISGRWLTTPANDSQHPTPETLQPKTAEPMPSKTGAPTSSLHDYFKTDNFGFIAATEPDHAVQFKNELIQIESKLYADFNGKSAFLGFYIPSTSRTYDVCVILMDDYRSTLEYFHKTMPAQVRLAGNRATELKDLKFTGRIFFYYEGALFQSQIDSLESKAAQKGLSLQFRGPDYAMLQNAGLTASPTPKR
jgi:hypothetical protein